MAWPPSPVTSCWRQRSTVRCRRSCIRCGRSTWALGQSGPVVQDGRLFILTRQGEEEIVLALSPATGAELWRYSYPVPYKEVDYASQWSPRPQGNDLRRGRHDLQLRGDGAPARARCQDRQGAVGEGLHSCLRAALPGVRVERIAAGRRESRHRADRHHLARAAEYRERGSPGRLRPSDRQGGVANRGAAAIVRFTGGRHFGGRSPDRHADAEPRRRRSCQ